MKLSANFTLSEMIKSDTAVSLRIDNRPTSEVITALTLLCINVLQPLRDKIGKPIRVSSGYRSRALNRAIKGAAQNSQHQKGEAADISVDGMSTDDLFQYILKSGIVYDQVIQEFDRWVHISFSATANRSRAYYAKKVNGQTKYIIHKK